MDPSKYKKVNSDDHKKKSINGIAARQMDMTIMFEQLVMYTSDQP